ncbi:hypothetical protein GWI33_014510 [Rhynchophorus ferrugineus]|uniref:Uncharacterized protein n=1 Tax=Rhynchophorus ferrugineus TaxID=354439 RepID=A0A834I506_RHYFE|nr:hypothetical protein GWI33_014510 [Rhynchophorus ferrugineus]
MRETLGGGGGWRPGGAKDDDRKKCRPSDRGAASKGGLRMTRGFIDPVPFSSSRQAGTRSSGCLCPFWIGNGVMRRFRDGISSGSRIFYR